MTRAKMRSMLVGKRRKKRRDEAFIREIKNGTTRTLGRRRG
jgi:hypothetical protein